MIATLQIRLAAALGLALLVAGCNSRLPGQPTEAERWHAPNEITDFNQLYAQNCAGCHGAGGRLGAARSLNDLLYLAFVTDDAMHQAIAKGRAGTNMPAFSEQAGGHLTDQQIELIVNGMRTNWSKPDDFKRCQPSSLQRQRNSDSERRRSQQRYVTEDCPGWRCITGRRSLQNLLFELSRNKWRERIGRLDRRSGTS